MAYDHNAKPLPKQYKAIMEMSGEKRSIYGKLMHDACNTYEIMKKKQPKEKNGSEAD